MFTHWHLKVFPWKTHLFICFPEVFVAFPACGKVGSPSLTVDCSFKQSTMPCGVPVPMYLPAGVKQLGEGHFPLVTGQSAPQQRAEEKQAQSWAQRSRPRMVVFRAGQDIKAALRPAAARDFGAVLALIYWLIVGGKSGDFAGSTP